jgi:hypothetical protein
MIEEVKPLSPGESCRLRVALPGETPSVIYGGHPRGIPMAQWPQCAVCGNPMCFMAQIEASPEVDLGPWARASVFICHATGGRCEDWDPFRGANKVILHAFGDDTLYDGPPTVRVYRRRALAHDAPQADRTPDFGGLFLAGSRSQPRRWDKVGGEPAWLHTSHPPPSPTGKGPMRLVLQLTSEIVRFDITEGGMAWVFLDPWAADEPQGRLVWQWR